MANERYYDATKYAHDLDSSHDQGGDYHELLCRSLYSEAIPADEFEKISRDAGVDLTKPDAESKHPSPIMWWNVATPTYVLIARDRERENHWGFPVRAEALMKRLAQHFDGKDAEEATANE